MDCPFCQINKKKTRILKQTKTYFVTLSNPRLVPGHLLVIPKRHLEKISQLNQQERKEIFNAIINIEEKVLKKVATGCDIKTHFRPFIKQNWVKVNHLHFHIQPRELEDELYQKSQKYEKEIWKNLPKNEERKFSKIFSS